MSAVVKRLPADAKAKLRTFRHRVKMIGARHRCPVCSCRVRAFERLPRFYTDNAQKYGFPFQAEQAETCNHKGYSCPSCQASDRDRLYALYLRDHLPETRTNGTFRIVDFAPSPPLSSFIRRRVSPAGSHVEYRTADLLADGVDDKLDITDLQPYPDGHFDFFICSHVLEHVADDKKALRELHRILKPAGRGILMVPIVLGLQEIDEDPSVFDEAERWRRFGQFDHVRLYSKGGFVERVKAAGFVVHQYGKELFGEKAFAEAGITDRSVLYVVTK